MVYDASSIQVIAPEDILESVRRRPGMYFGHLGPRAVLHVMLEMISNAADQFLSGYATWMKVAFDGPIIHVWDDGPGLPFEQIEHEQSLGSVFLMRPHVTPSATGHAPHIHMHGVHGLGLAPINAACSVFECWSWRHGQRWYQRFEDGLPVDDARVVAQGDGVGTHFQFQVHVETLEASLPDMEALRQALVRVASLSPGFRVYFEGDEICYPRGLRDRLIELVSPSLTDSQLKRWIDTQLFSFEHRTPHFAVQVAVGGHAEETIWYSWVNGVRSPDGGIHERGFERLLSGIDWSPEYVLLSVIGLEPQYANPTRDELRHLESWQDIEQVLWDALAHSKFYS